MDVHDTPTIDRHEALQPGMIITIEPGVYISASSAQNDFLTKVGREFAGIGIRIEDDVLVNPEGRDVLTAPCPKTIDEIEYWGRQRTTA
jgi:Xaa-Pro aminopeptidase